MEEDNKKKKLGEKIWRVMRFYESVSPFVLAGVAQLVGQ